VKSTAAKLQTQAKRRLLSAPVTYGLALTMALLAALLYFLWRDHAAKIEAGEHQVAAITLGSDRQLTLEMRTIERALQEIAGHARTLSLIAPERAPTLLRENIAAVRRLHAELADIVIVDDTGAAVSDGDGDPDIVHWARRPENRVAADGLIIGPPRLAPTGQWILPVAVPLIAAEPGPRQGWVLARLRLSALWDIIGGLDVGRHGVANIFHRNGTMLARSRHPERAVGQDFSQSELMRELLPRSPIGSSDRVSPVDGVRRILAYRALERYPLVVVAGVSRREFLGPWYSRAAGVAVIVVFYALGWLLLVRVLSSAQEEQAALMTELQAARDTLLDAQEIAKLGSWSLDLATGKIEFSQVAQDLYGWVPGKTPLTLQTWLAQLHPDDRERVEAQHARHVAEDTFDEMRFRTVRPDGSIRSLVALGQVVETDDGRRMMVGTVQDITDLEQAHAQLQKTEAQYKLLFEQNPLPFWVFHRETLQILEANEAAIAQYGYSREEFQALNLSDIRPAEDVAEMLAAARSPNPEKRRGRIWRHVRKDGTVFNVAVHSSDITFDGQPARLVLVLDITERERYEAQLAYQASHDELTGLLNRGALLRSLADLLDRVGDAPVALLYIDINNFKLINDSQGHEVGDEVLRVVANRLRALVPNADRVCRLGGNEFLVVIADVVDQAAADAVVATILAALAQPIEALASLHYLSLNAGIVRYPEQGRDPELLLKNAGLATHEAKRRGQNRLVEHAPAFEHAVSSRQQLASRLHEAMQKNEFEMFFQPLFNTSWRRPIGLEALIRWRHPERGLVPPSEFIPVCEDSGLIVPLGRWVLREACRYHRLLAAAGWPQLTIAVNVSAMQFLSGELKNDIPALLREFDIPKGVLELELTESLIMENPESVIEVMRELRQYGVLLSIDDFGTGYSSMSYLHRLPVDKLKIDRSFVANVDTDRHNAAICLAVLALARSFELKVIAEGVETQAQFDWLRAHDCDEVQGYLFARPEAFEEMLTALGPANEGVGENHRG
jgi:diguanylate cyclase (GGDEF)-like protein/PAS domain S-box-containing protein